MDQVDRAEAPPPDRLYPTGPTCPFTIERPIMQQRWERLTFLHWRFDRAAVQALLPPGLRVDPWDGSAWVGLVPFLMRAGSPGGHLAPWASTFCETNVRTYVIDHEGRPGIWFFSLDASRLGAVTAARAGYRLPYFWSSMRLSESGADPARHELTYDCIRRWPGPRTATSRVRIAVGDPIALADLDERDHFLTGRWILFSTAGDRRRFARAAHEPWPLHRVEVLTADDDLIVAAGLPRPQGPPLAHYSPGVHVRIGRPERYPR